MVQRVMEQLQRCSAGDAGQGMAEYGLILALVAVVVIVALTALGGGVSSTFNTIAGQV
jgi:pilus assembly protein Flp/PilA